LVDTVQVGNNIKSHLWNLQWKKKSDALIQCDKFRRPSLPSIRSHDNLNNTEEILKQKLHQVKRNESSSASPSHNHTGMETPTKLLKLQHSDFLNLSPSSTNKSTCLSLFGYSIHSQKQVKIYSSFVQI